MKDKKDYNNQIYSQEDQNEEEVVDNIKELGTSLNLPYKSNIRFITIIGEIEGHNISNADKKTTKYEHIIPLLIDAQMNPEVKGILVVLNTVGGDVEAGLALSEMINSINKPTVSLVLGGGHSIGVPLATSSDYSFIVPTATMTIHPIRTTGLVIGVQQTFKYFEKMQKRINDFVIKTSKISYDKLNELMYTTDQLANDVGTILVGKEAVDHGLINEVGGLSEAINKLDSLIDDKIK